MSRMSECDSDATLPTVDTATRQQLRKVFSKDAAEAVEHPILLSTLREEGDSSNWVDQIRQYATKNAHKGLISLPLTTESDGDSNSDESAYPRVVHIKMVNEHEKVAIWSSTCRCHETKSSTEMVTNANEGFGTKFQYLQSLEDIQALPLWELQEYLEYARKLEHQLRTERRAMKEYIDLLHRYNDIKDVAQECIGKIAEMDGVTTKDLYPEYNLQLDD